tara:strand:+ start:45 stop:395 length:351 start_codon:yes stop_codon:yes gene_type:complete
MKTCIRCEVEKKDTCFEISSTTKTKTYRKRVCYDCRKEIRKVEKSLQKMHGKTKPLGTPCDCCGRTDVLLCLDHCHITGKLRGYLCQTCNVSIGGLGDTLAGVKMAEKYLMECEFK